MPPHPSLIPPGGLGPPPLLPSSRGPQGYPGHSRGGPPPASLGHHPPPPPHPSHQTHPQKSDGDVQVIHESRFSPQQPPQAPQVPRPPSPPAKIDGSECHRSQSAIFTKLVFCTNFNYVTLLLSVLIQRFPFNVKSHSLSDKCKSTMRHTA